MARHTILVAEDEAIVAADLSHKLSSLGYEVIGTTSSGDIIYWGPGTGYRN